REEYPWDNVKDLAAAGFMGMTIPAAHGGGERPLLDVVLVIEEIARACGITGRIVVEGNLGTVGALLAYGTEAQKRRYFPWVLEGEKPAIAISEPAAGSAATDMTTSAEETATGFRLDGHKCWITGAGTSRLYLVYARFGGRAGADGIGGIFVERDTPGFRIGRRELMMGLRGIPEGELHFDGFKRLMNAYNGQRLGAATVALGIAQGAYERALAYAAECRQFGRAIGEFQGIRWKLADMAIKLDAARLLIHRAAANAGTGFPDALEAAKAKTFGRDRAGGDRPGAPDPRRGRLRPRAPARAYGARRPHVRHRWRDGRDDAQPHRRPPAPDEGRLPPLIRAVRRATTVGGGIAPSELVAAVEEGELEYHEVAVGGEDGAGHRQDQAEGEDQARPAEDGHRGHHDRDLEQRLRDQEVRIPSLEAVAYRL